MSLQSGANVSKLIQMVTNVTIRLINSIHEVIIIDREVLLSFTR